MVASLTTLANLRLMPGFTDPPYDDDYLNFIVSGVNQAIISWLKRDIELTLYTEYYSGTNQMDLVLKQWPVWAGATSIAAGSNGVALPTATINVEDTSTFPTSGQLAVQGAQAAQNPTVVTYTGKTSTTFTGCTGGSGTLATGYSVGSPLVYMDTRGAWGQFNGGFPAASLLWPGRTFAAIRDQGGTKSYRGLLRMLGGYGTLYGGFWGGFSGASPFGTQGKLAASKQPCWPTGNGNIKVVYTAGYATIPADLAMAANTLAALVARTMPTGGMPMQSEGYEGYSYSLATQMINGGGSYDTIPELYSVRGVLVQYREYAM